MNANTSNPNANAMSGYSSSTIPPQMVNNSSNSSTNSGGGGGIGTPGGGHSSGPGGFGPSANGGDNDDTIYFPYCDDVNKYEKIGKIGQGKFFV